jgi:YgiT-type zinc finger domain-containing protein
MNEVRCLSCKGTMSIIGDLTFDVVLSGERIVIPNLTGFRCNKCGDGFFDPESINIIEKYTSSCNGGYEVNVTEVGVGKLGIHFPKDIFRVMNIKKGEKAILTPLSKSKMILELKG